MATIAPTGADAAFAPSRPAPAAQPRRMAAIAALRGATPPDVTGATVVELGCSDGANLLAIAAAHPAITAVGIDPHATALERGRAVATEAGLTNVTFAEGTVAPLDDEAADFVIAGDVLSWVDADARATLIAEAARITRKGGLVMLSYDAIPGAIGRLLTRSIGRRAAAAEIEAGDAQATRAAVVSALHAAARNGTAGPDFTALATSEAERVTQLSPERLLHDELAEHWEPLAVSELAEQAARAGLAYLGELAPADRWRERLPEADVRRVVKLAGNASAMQQQLVDDMLGAASHASLFMRGAAPKEPIGGGARRPAGPPADQWHAALEHPGEWPELPANLAPVAAEIRAAGPAGVSVATIAERTGSSAEAVRQAASVLDAAGLARLDLEPSPAVAAPSDHPRASALAQAQARLGQSLVTSLGHRDVLIEDPRLRALLLLLDGTRDRAALATEIAASGLDGAAEFAATIDDLLVQFAAAGLLAE